MFFLFEVWKVIIFEKGRAYGTTKRHKKKGPTKKGTPKKALKKNLVLPEYLPVKTFSRFERSGFCMALR